MCSSTFDAGNLPVRFDEREQETGSSQTGLRGRGRKPGHTPTGRLSSLRLFSTLLSIALTETFFSEGRAQACENAWLRQPCNGAYHFNYGRDGGKPLSEMQRCCRSGADFLSRVRSTAQTNFSFSPIIRAGIKFGSD